MDNNREYHDPDYPEVAVCVKEEPPILSEEDKVEKIKSIICREFSKELQVRESEVMLIDQRMLTSRRLLHRLRYALVTRYYTNQKLQVSSGQTQDEIASQRDPRARAEVASLLREGQRQLHPSVRKLVGKQTVDIDEIFRTRGPRNKTRRDYSAMLQKRNYTISADTTKSLRPEEPPEPEAAGGAPRKVPRHLEPKITNVLTLDEATRNKMKHRYRIVIGNTSKYVPAASRLDRSTHKWLLYVRGAPPAAAAPAAAAAADLSRLVSAVTVTLHHSYAPHHVVHLHKPPFHVSRRGWGEFPARVELQFALPHRNRPAHVTHTIKLDRNYTGMQMLGSETVVDVWLYSTQEMLQYEYKEDENTHTPTHTPTHTDTNTNTITENHTHTDTMPEIKTEQDTEISDDNWMDFFTKAPTELDVDEMIIKPVKKENLEEPLEQMDVSNEEIDTNTECPQNDVAEKHESILEVPNEIMNQPPSIKKRIVKYIDPTTGKIYYLEMDRELDLTKVQEIIINNTAAKISPIKSNGLKSVRKKKGISLLKPEIKSQLRSEQTRTEKLKPNLTHIENDHCYLAAPKPELPARLSERVSSPLEINKEPSLYANLCSVMHRFTCVRAAINYLVKKIPLISDEASDPDFQKNFPFCVESCEKYWKMDFAKRRNIEWSRAKLIQQILTEHFRHTETIWRTKQILLYIRLHGHHPIRNEYAPIQAENNDWSSWNDVENIRKMESNIKETYPNASDINTLTVFNFDFDRSLNDSLVISDDEEIDILSTDVKVKVKKEVGEVGALEVLPVEREEDRLRFTFVERKCQDIGIELRNENIGNGYSYSAVHAVLMSAMQSFAEELIRTALAHKRKRDNPRETPTVWNGCPSSRSTISLCDIYSAAGAARLRLLTSRDTATLRKRTHAI